MQGGKVKARTAYQDFLTLPKDADPDIPTFLSLSLPMRRTLQKE
jgi:hypothetical protein